MRPIRLAAVAGTLLLAMTAACGSSPGSTTATTAATPAMAVIPVAQRSPAGIPGKEPTVVVPTGQPPSALEYADLITGRGAAATARDTVTVQYVGYSWTNRKMFQASWTTGNGAPISFSLAGVIQGWSEGLVGMKVGGRRELFIPPSLAYGAPPPVGSGIPANDTLIFIVDLIKIG